MNPLIDVIIEEAPALIKLIRDQFAQRHPDKPEPTASEITAAFETTFQDSIAKDRLIRSLHQK